jgi:hypothetical protein
MRTPALVLIAGAIIGPTVQPILDKRAGPRKRHGDFAIGGKRGIRSFQIRQRNATAYWKSTSECERPTRMGLRSRVEKL